MVYHLAKRAFFPYWRRTCRLGKFDSLQGRPEDQACLRFRLKFLVYLIGPRGGSSLLRIGGRSNCLHTARIMPSPATSNSYGFASRSSKNRTGTNQIFVEKSEFLNAAVVSIFSERTVGTALGGRPRLNTPPENRSLGVGELDATEGGHGAPPYSTSYEEPVFLTTSNSKVNSLPRKIVER